MREGNVTIKAKSERKILEDAIMLTLKMEEGSIIQGI